MTYQAYLDAVKTKTGKTVANFRVLAEQSGLSKHRQIVKWLKADFALGHGHATAVAGAILKPDRFKAPAEDRVGQVFTGKKAIWRPAYDALLAEAEQFGPDVGVAPTVSYVSLLRGGKKFAIVQPASNHLNLGLKLKDTAPEGRLEAAGTWNSMVTHRVRVNAPGDIDAEVLAWLKRAYAAC